MSARETCSTPSGGALRGTSVGMILRVEELEDPFHCPRCPGCPRSGGATVSASDRRFSISASGNVGLRATSTMIARMSSKSSDEARARDGQRLPVRRHPQRYAAVVELVGQHGGAPRRRAPIQHAARQIGEARTFWRIEDAAGAESRADRDRRRHRGFLHKDDRAVGQLLADRRQPLSERGRHQRDSSGWNEPTVSWFRRRRRCGDVAHLVGGHGVDARLQPRVEARPDDGLEVAELMGDVSDAVVFEDQPRTQLPLRAGDLAVVDAARPQPARALRTRPPPAPAAARPPWP